MGIFKQTAKQLTRRRYIGTKRAFNKMLATTRRYNRRRAGKARPMKSLRSTYKGIPNQYRFKRQEVSSVIDLRTYATFGGTVAVLDIDNFKMNILANFVNDFGPLFASYKLDKLVFTLKPLWQISAVDVQGTGTIANPELTVTRVNTKYLTQPLNLGATDAAIRSSLAQLQMKTESSYSGKRNLYLVTKYPRMFDKVEDQTTATAMTTVPARWLSISQNSDIEFPLNQVVVFQKRDHSAIQGGVYQYEISTTAYFRCSQVG